MAKNQATPEEVAKAMASLEAAADELGIKKGVLFHPGSDSLPDSHQGGKLTAISGFDMADSTGMDYNTVKKALAVVGAKRSLTVAEQAVVLGGNPLPAIFAKAAAQEALTQAETWVLAGGYAQIVKSDDADEDDKKEDKDDMDKSLRDAVIALAAKQQPAAQPDDRIARLEKGLGDLLAYQEEIGKSVRLLGQQHIAAGEEADDLGKSPAHEPRGQVTPEVVEGQRVQDRPFGIHFGEHTLQKGAVAEVMEAMIKSGDEGISLDDMLDWEGFGRMRDDLRARITARIHAVPAGIQ